MLPKSQKIPTNILKDLRKKQPKYLYKGVLFNISFYPLKDDASSSKFMVIVPKRTVSKAVLRNLVKRQTYFVIMQRRKKFPKGYFVIVLKKDISNFSRKSLYEKIVSEFDTFLSKVP